MNFINAIILGIVEGVTEYLPISSTFHLIWSAKILALPQTEFLKMFEVVIQSGAILAVVALYWKTLINDWSLVKKLFVSFVPTAMIGFLLYKLIKNVFFESYLVQIAIFILVGLFFLILEKRWEKKKLSKNIFELTYLQAVLIGLAQSLAVFPGVSRAGAVMIAMMLFKTQRKEAAKYSFLLAVPTLISASFLDLLKSRSVLVGQSANLSLLLVGFIASFISALIVMRWFISFLQTHKISIFGWYRLILGLILLGVLFI